MRHNRKIDRRMIALMNLLQRISTTSDISRERDYGNRNFRVPDGGKVPTCIPVPRTHTAPTLHAYTSSLFPKVYSAIHRRHPSPAQS